MTPEHCFCGVSGVSQPSRSPRDVGVTGVVFRCRLSKPPSPETFEWRCVHENSEFINAAEVTARRQPTVVRGCFFFFLFFTPPPEPCGLPGSRGDAPLCCHSNTMQPLFNFDETFCVFFVKLRTLKTTFRGLIHIISVGEEYVELEL